MACSSGRRSELLNSLEASLKLTGGTHSKGSLFALARVVVFFLLSRNLVIPYPSSLSFLFFFTPRKLQ